MKAENPSYVQCFLDTRSFRFRNCHPPRKSAKNAGIRRGSARIERRPYSSSSNPSVHLSTGVRDADTGSQRGREPRPPRKLTRFASRKKRSAERRPSWHVTRGGPSGGPLRVASGLRERQPPPTRPHLTRTAAAGARGPRFHSAAPNFTRRCSACHLASLPVRWGTVRGGRPERSGNNDQPTTA